MRHHLWLLGLLACTSKPSSPAEYEASPSHGGPSEYMMMTWAHPSAVGGETEVRIQSFMARVCDVPTPHFATDAVDLRNKAEHALDALARCVTEGALQGATLTLLGHPDARGTEVENQRLGLGRVSEVAKYLSDRGVPEEQIVTLTLGEAGASGITTVGWADDRRVDIRTELE